MTSVGEGQQSELRHRGKFAEASIKQPSKEPAPIRNLYVAATAYDGFTITDGALRIVVLLHADSLGFDAIQIAIMFSLYEVAGIFTNLFGGVAGSKLGLFFTLITSLLLQMLCLGALMLISPLFGQLDRPGIDSNTRLRATVWITAFQAFSGVAKDFMKLTGKSTPKLVTKAGQEGRLFRIVAWLTGMKNSFKGAGNLIGAALVGSIGYVLTLLVLIVIVAVFLPIATLYMDHGLGKSAKGKKIDWIGVFRKGRDVNVLSAARFFLFGSRDIWLEIALPLFLKNSLGWNNTFVGLFTGAYIIVYGNLQALSTNLYRKGDNGVMGRPESSSVTKWALACAVTPAFTASLMYYTFNIKHNKVTTTVVMCIGLLAFAAIFAVNSSIHSYLIVSYSDSDKVAQDLGFYYMANAGGRLVGVLIGGVIYQYTAEAFGLSMVLWIATPFLIIAALFGAFLTGAYWGPAAPVGGVTTDGLIDSEPHGTVDDIEQLEMTAPNRKEVALVV